MKILKRDSKKVAADSNQDSEPKANLANKDLNTKKNAKLDNSEE